MVQIVSGMHICRYARATIKALAHCWRQGAQIVVVSDSLVSPAAKYAYLLIVGLTDGVSFSDSAVSFVFQLECIMNAVTGETKKRRRSDWNRSRSLGRRFEVFSGVEIPRSERNFESANDT